MSLYQKVTAANALEVLAKRAADEKSYHQSKVAHYEALAEKARQAGCFAEVIGLETMAARHHILSVG
jgi:hypothetical protein